MRSITENLLLRLGAQLEEVETLKKGNIADSLKHQIQKNAENTRKDDEFYSYSHDELRKDVNNLLWDVTLRVADYLGVPFDSVDVQASIDKVADDFIHELFVRMGASDGVGTYEPTVPGEERTSVLLDVKDNDEQ